jgi:hypothetical protein
MSIRRYRVESLDFVKKQYETWGKEKFFNHYVKGDAFIGNKEGIDFIDAVLRENIEGWVIRDENED